LSNDERVILHAVLAETAADLGLDPRALRQYSHAVDAAITVMEERVQLVLAAGEGCASKMLKVAQAAGLSPMLQAAAFTGFRGGNVRAAIVAGLLRTRRIPADMPRWTD